MPELPEVETIVQDLRPRLVGRRILSASLRHDDVLRQVSRRALLAALMGCEVMDVSRRAKHAVLTLDCRRVVIQPGMSGGLTVHEGALSDDEARYAVLRARLDDGAELVYRDVRRLGRIYLLGHAGWRHYDARLGPEPLDPALDAAALHQRLVRSRQAVKKLIMDQRVIVGIGNIYANEALFAARIDPRRPGTRMRPADTARLLAEARRILGAAITARGTTLRDYRTGTGGKGDFQLELLAYGRGGEPCVRCGRRLRETHALDARTTVWCTRCQR